MYANAFFRSSCQFLFFVYAHCVMLFVSFVHSRKGKSFFLFYVKIIWKKAYCIELAKKEDVVFHDTSKEKNGKIKCYHKNTNRNRLYFLYHLHTHVVLFQVDLFNFRHSTLLLVFYICFCIFYVAMI